MRISISIAMAILLVGCVHQPSPGPAMADARTQAGSAMADARTQAGPTMSAPGQLNAATKEQKRECERLLNAVLPSAEQMLSRHRQIYPFAIALTREGKVISTSRDTAGGAPRSPITVAVLETGLQQGAKSGRYKATALVLDMMVVAPFQDVQQHAIAIRLDHRGGYSVVVFYPYELRDGGSLAIGAPFSVWGEKKIFPQ